MKLNKNIKVLESGELICNIDTDNPNLSQLIESITKKNIDYRKITCETNIENFDIVSFEGILKSTIKSINNELESELEKYDIATTNNENHENVYEFFESYLNKN